MGRYMTMSKSEFLSHAYTPMLPNAHWKLLGFCQYFAEASQSVSTCLPHLARRGDLNSGRIQLLSHLLTDRVPSFSWRCQQSPSNSADELVRFCRKPAPTSDERKIFALNSGSIIAVERPQLWSLHVRNAQVEFCREIFMFWDFVKRGVRWSLIPRSDERVLWLSRVAGLLFCFVFNVLRVTISALGVSSPTSIPAENEISYIIQ